MSKTAFKSIIRKKRQIRVRKKIKGNSERPRLSVFRSSKHIYAQIIDDTSNKTLVSFSSLNLKIDEALGSTGNIKSAILVGRGIAAVATTNGLKSVVFDRNGFLYHGRIKALADAARESGLVF